MLEPPLLNETLRVEDNNDGTYKALWLTTRTGKFRLWIAGPCGPIKDSPYDVECLPAALSVTHSYLKGDGASDAIAGHAAAFEIVARDVFDNTLAFGRYAWATSLSNDQNSLQGAPARGLGRRLVQVCVQRDARGDLRPDDRLAGLGGSVNGSVQIQDSPFTVTVRPGPISGPKSKIYGPNCPEGEDTWNEGSGRPVRLWIEARDRFENQLDVAPSIPAPFTVKVRRKGASKVVATAVARSKDDTACTTSTSRSTTPETTWCT